jgi:hypothetical protein
MLADPTKLETIFGNYLTAHALFQLLEVIMVPLSVDWTDFARAVHASWHCLISLVDVWYVNWVAGESEGVKYDVDIEMFFVC